MFGVITFCMLEFSICFPVLAPNATVTSCGSHVTQEEGVAASAMAADGGPGSTTCPLVIEVKVHQRVNVSLVDLSVAPNAEYWSLTSSLGGGGGAPAVPVTCSDPLAMVVDDVSGRTVSVCTRGRRYSHVMTSESNRITVTLNTRTAGHFLLQYEGQYCDDCTFHYDILHCNGFLLLLYEVSAE